MTAEALDDIPSLTLSKSWLKLLGTGYGISETSDESAQDQTCGELAMQLDNNLSNSDISDCIGADGCDPGYLVLTDQDIMKQVACTNPQLSTKNESDNKHWTPYHHQSFSFIYIDFAILRRRDLKKCLDVSVKCGAECNTDHQLLRI